MIAKGIKAKINTTTTPVVQPETIQTYHEPTAVAVHDVTVGLESVERAQKDKKYLREQEIEALFLRTESLRSAVDRIDMVQREILEHLRRAFPSTFRRVGA